MGSQPYALGLGVQALFARFNDKPRGAQLEMHCSIDPRLPTWVLLDARRFHQILENLLDNALKFTPPGGSIDMHVTEQDGQAVLSLARLRLRSVDWALQRGPLGSPLPLRQLHALQRAGSSAGSCRGAAWRCPGDWR